MNRKRKFFFAALTGVVLGFCIIAGQRLDTIYSLEIMEKSFYIKWLFCAIVLGMSTHLIWEKIFLKKKQNLQNIINKMECAISKVDKKITYPIIVIILLLVWLPVWLSIFPGAFSYDAYDEWMQIYTGKITAHHPVLHVIFMGGLVEGMYQLTGNYNCGIAIYTVIQMVICACTFAYTIEFLR